MDNNFKPVYLYVKKHNTTGMLYFGRTVKKNPVKYRGSGKYCTENNLSQSALYQVALGNRKQHKGYTCKKIGE